MPDEPVFREKRAAFVTLTRNGRLRGCIGTLLAVESLGDSVRHNALNAALRDPRFAPLAAAELPEIRIEISVLDAPAPLVYRDSEDLLSQLQAERPGLILEADGHRATFLPQVWAQHCLSDILLDIGTTILYVLFVDNTGRIYSLCDLIDIICSIGKQALQISERL